MADTPFFPDFSRFFPSRKPIKFSWEGLRRCTLFKLEDRFGKVLSGIDELSAAKASARERPYSVRRTFWCLLWQMLQINVSCREVVRQLQSMLSVEQCGRIQEGNSAYCQARERLPIGLLTRALKVTAQVADQQVEQCGFLQNRVIKVMDGTTLTLPDTAENQKVYPQPVTQKPGCGFPIMHLVVVWSARGGGVLDYVKGNYHQGEMRLLHQLGPTLTPDDIVIYDRAAGNYVACALMKQRSVDLISRVAIRHIDWRRGQRLGPDDRLVTWKKTHKRPVYTPVEEWATLPPDMKVRVIRIRINQKGFRSRELCLVTTLLDPVAYPAAQIREAFWRRWRLEMCLDDLKTTLGADALRCRSPDMIERELLAILIVHNLVRGVMAEAARDHNVPLDRLSVKGSIDTLRNFCVAIALATTGKRRKELWCEMLGIMAADLVPLRPGRWEPRAVKRRPKPYPRLDKPRREYTEIRHGNSYSHGNT